MNKQTSILTDIDLEVVAGGSFITQMAAAGVKGAAKGAAPNFGSVYTGPKTSGSGRCDSNHNGVHY